MCRLIATTFVLLWFFFFFNDTATTEIYTLSLHDALPIFAKYVALWLQYAHRSSLHAGRFFTNCDGHTVTIRSEERFSRNAETDLVCRLLLEKKKKESRREAAL